jgi:S-DNA-T family DNA segregation ATPase FtsK/SpoIIIE
MSYKNTYKNVVRNTENNNSTTSTTKSRLPKQNLLEDRRLRLTFGFAVVFFSVILGLSLLSAFFTGAADQSVIGSLAFGEFDSAAEQVDNWLGVMGAVMSYFLVFRWFGVSSFLFVPLLFVVGLFIIQQKKIRHIWRVIILLSFTLVWISILLGLIVLKSNAIGTLAYVCGGVGYETAYFFNALLGGFGTVLLLTLALIAFVAYFFNPDFLYEKLSFLGVKNATKEESTNTQTPSQDSKSVQKTITFVPEHEEKQVQEPISTDKKKTPVQKKKVKKTPQKIVVKKTEKITQKEEEKLSVGEVKEKTDTHTKINSEPTEREKLKTEQAADKLAQDKKEIEGKKAIQDSKSESKQENKETKKQVENKSRNEITPDNSTQKEEITTKIPQKEAVSFEEVVLDKQDDTQEENISTKEEIKVPEVKKPVFFDPVLALDEYQFPTLDLLDVHSEGGIPVSMEELQKNKEKIKTTLENFKIGVEEVKAVVGPTVTLYEIVPKQGVKISKIRSLEDDIALNLSALGTRIIAPMPGRGTIGIEVPNKNREMVSFKNLIDTPAFRNTKKSLPVVLGKSISNEVFIFDLAKAPHLLIGGATGQGKSVGINVLLASLLYAKHPGELKIVLIDPKKVEFSLYGKLEKHFLTSRPDNAEPVITESKEAYSTLSALCVEMDKRYNLLKNAGCRHLQEYNAKFISKKLTGKGDRYLPYIVVVIDELADLMMTVKAIERPIARLAQMARAVGIHLVLATQRPSVNVLTGVIKANFPSRIAFRVTSKVDSRVILDASGAEQLVGQGDMLLSNGSDMVRLQCAFIDTMEVERVCAFIEEQKGFKVKHTLPEWHMPLDEGNSKKGGGQGAMF